MTANSDDSPSTHPFGNLMLGRILVERQVLVDEQVDACLEQQKDETRSRGRRRALGVIVVERGFAKPEQVEAALAFQRQQFSTQVVGPYRLAEKLGEGGSSVVYRAIAVDGGRAVALKILPQNAPGDVAAIARFQKEAQAGMTLQHPHIVKTLDWGTHRDAYWLAMELMPGGTLLQRVRQEGPLNESAVLELACGMLDALRLASERNMVHRDIKPTNILFDARGQGKLADLGLAQLIASPNDLGPGKLVGTPAYISPEQALGQGVDARSDLYSLGATLFHALTGGPPFVEPSAIDLANHHLNTAPHSADDINPEVSAGTAAVVRKLLAKRQADRYSSAREALADVRRVLEGLDPIALTLSVAKAFAPLDVQLRVDQPTANGQRQAKGKGKPATPASIHFDVVAEPAKPAPRNARKPDTGSQRRGAKTRGGSTKLKSNNPVTLVIAAVAGVAIAAAGGGAAWWWTNRKPSTPAVAATPEADAPATVAKAVRTIDLLGTIDGRKLNADDWAKRDGVLVSTRGARRLLPLSQPAFPEYDLNCTFKRLNPTGSLVLVLNVGGHPVCWMVGGEGEPRAGLDEVHGKGIDTNGTAHPLPLGLDPDKRHSTVVQVRKDSLTCRVDGRALLVHPTTGADLSIDAKWELADKATLGIGSAGTQVAIYRLELTEIAEVAASPTPVPASPPSP